VKQGQGKLIEEARPLARKDGLVIEELDDEILIYDTERDKAHCLNAAAARIWKHCDGKHTVEDIKHTFAADVPIEATREMVSDCVLRFNRVHLLERDSLPFRGDAVLSRRKLLRKVGIGAAATAIVLPLITSIVAPPPAAAASCGSFSCVSGGAAFCKTLGLGCNNCGATGHCRP
jgi:hypothetical protein